MGSKLLIVVLIFLSIRVSGVDYDRVSIGILEPQRPRVVQIITENGSYTLKVGGVAKLNLATGDRVMFSFFESMVKVTQSGKVIGRYKSVDLIANDSTGVFRLFILSPDRTERVYDDNLNVSLSGHALKLINTVALEKYVAGVVEAETGKEKELEFYKVQAIISRTYALNNLRKNYKNGYNLNDQVDCQVYHGKCRWEPDILTAVDETRGMVLVDSDMKLITAAFHSNSGGETVSSESVWSGALPYLIPRKDEFSENGDHAVWSKTIAVSDWLNYLKKNYNLQVDDKLISAMSENYEQENRQIFFLDPIFNIPLKDIRKDWKLNSTYFNIEPQGQDSLVFEGRGFGHGAGLSQEGAMRMADLGFSYSDILHFYYNDVHIVDLDSLDFFRTD